MTRRARAALLLLGVLLALSIPASASAASPHASGVSIAACNACHVPHAATTRGSLMKGGASAAPGEAPTCLFCHDGTGATSNVADGPDSFAGVSGHTLEGAVAPAPMDLTNSCSDCHSPHGDPALSPKLPAKTVNGVTVTGAGTAWCLACHNDANSWYERIGVYPALSDPSRDATGYPALSDPWRDATGYPVAGTYAGATVYADPARNAHASIPATTTPDVRTQGDCRYCHNAHGSSNPYDGLSATFRPSTDATADSDRADGTYAAVCFSCHDGSRVDDGAANIKQFVTYNADKTGLMDNGGHRIKSGGGTLPAGAPLPCYDCHNPHGSSRGNSTLITDELGGGLDTRAVVGTSLRVRQFCLTCHTTWDTVAGWDSDKGTYASLVSSTAEVEGLRRNGGAVGSGPESPVAGDDDYNWLRLKDTPGHYEVDTQSCYECHGNAYGAPDANNVHDPGSYSVALHTATLGTGSITILGTTYGPYACTDCHDEELGPEHDRPRSSSNATDCGTCHPTPRDSVKTPPWDHNTCTQGNCHAGTSPDPMHGTIDTDHTVDGTCSSANCHSTDAAAIHAVVGGPGCPACHGPGITPTLSCGACHPRAHPNTVAAPGVNHGPSTDQCGSCHSTANLMGVHGDNCTKCHPTPATPATVYAGGCAQAGCHPGVHADYAGGYHPLLDHGDGPYCEDCHSSGDNGCADCHRPHELGAPVTVSDARATYNTVGYVVLTAVDQGGAGVKATYYQVDGGPIQTGNTILVPGPTVGSRSHSIEFWSVDNQYNVESHHIAHFTIAAPTATDTNPPTGTMAVNNGNEWTNTTSATLNSAVVDAETVVVSMRVDPGTGTFGAWIPYVISYPFTLPAGSGLKTVRAEYMDYAGNLVALSDTVTIETVRPAGGMTVGNGSGYSNTLLVTVNSTMTDNLSGMAWMSIKGAAWVPYSATATCMLNNLVGSNQQVYVQYADAAWNVVTRVVYVVYDPLVPTGTMTVNNGATYTASQAVTMNSAITDTGGSTLSQMRVDPGTGTFGAWGAYASSYPLTLPAGDGLKTVRAEYTDRAGNVLSKTWDITVGGGGDITPPTGSIIVNAGASTTQVTAVNLALSGADTGGSGLSEMRFSNDNASWTPWQTYATSYTGWTLLAGDGSKTVYVQYRDFQGNISSSYADTIWLDGTPPAGSVVINGGAAYCNSVTVTLTCPATDPLGGAPGTMQMRFSLNGGTSWSGWTNYTPTRLWTFSAGEGTKTVLAQYKDYAGNLSEFSSDSIIYDVTGPTGSIDINGGAATTNSASVMLTLAATDTGGANMGEMRFSNDNASWSAWEPYSTTKAWTLVAGDGAKTVYVQYRDAALNSGISYSDGITLDTTGADTIAPAGTVSINSGAAMTTSAAVTLTLSATDTGGSGLAQMRFSNDNAMWSAWQTYATTRDWTLSAGAGAKNVYVQYKDNAGNESGSFNDDVTLSPLGEGTQLTTLPIDTDTWVDAESGASGQWSTYSIYVNDVLIGTKAGTSGPSWACPTVDLGPGGHIDIVVDCDFTSYSSVFAEDRPNTFTLPLPADATRIEATTWTGFSAEGSASGWWDPYEDYYTGVYLSATTIGNILYSLPSDPDTTPPTGSVTINGGATYASSATVSLETPAADTGGSGLSQMRFSNDNVNWTDWETYAAAKTWTLTPGDGAKTVYVQYNDNAGYISSTYADGIALDTAPPTGTIIIDWGAAAAASTSVTLTLSASDVGSGVAQMRFSNDNVNWTTWETYGTTKAWTLAGGTGSRTVYVQYRDDGGAVSSSFSDSINLLANFTLNYSAGVGGVLSGSTTQNVMQGMSGTAVTAVPDVGQKFIGWSDGRLDNPRTDNNVAANVTATAWFAPSASYVVKFYTDTAGYVDGGQWIQGVQSGTSSAPVTAVAYHSYYYAFSYWSNGTSYVYTPTLQLNNVTSDQTWTAYFTWTGTCPFLYTWDGDSFEFEADEFAAGYLGLRTSKGYRRPNPIDYHVLATTPAVKDGALEYQLVEERDETDYIDQAKLYTVDAPANRDVYVERSQAEGVGQFTTIDAVVHTVAKNLEAPPSVKWVNSGQEVRDLVSASDGDYLVLNYDRNVGYNYQTLELDLGDVTDAPMVKLVIDGRTMVPSSPEGRAYSRTFGPQVKFEVQDAAGNWVAVPTTAEILPKPPEFDRPFVMDLSNIWISDSRKVRFTYLYKTYIDSILLDTTADVPVTITELPLQSAELQAHGFNFKSGTGELFEYVYGDPFQPARYKLPGYYTKFGDVTPLLGEMDDKFVIFGGGDQITLRFEPPASSWAGTRRYLFFSNGYYKTLKEDISHTVEPLPFAAMSNFPYPATESYPTDAEHQAYLLEWNTRYEED